MQVEDDRLNHGAHRGLDDDEAPTGTTPGARHLLVLHQADRLAEDGTAHLVALEQLGLGPEYLADRPSEHHDVLDDAVGHLGRPLRARIGARPRHVAGCRPRHRPIVPAAFATSSVMTCMFRKRVCRKGPSPSACGYMKTWFAKRRVMAPGVIERRATPSPTPPPRRPGSVRRTSSVLMSWPDGLTEDLLLEGRARDLLTPAEGDAEVLDHADVVARTGRMRDIKRIESDPEPAGPAAARRLRRRRQLAQGHRAGAARGGRCGNASVSPPRRPGGCIPHLRLRLLQMGRGCPRNQDARQPARRTRSCKTSARASARVRLR